MQTDEPNVNVLHISNFSETRCGVAEWGRQFSQAVRDAGHTVDDWDGGYQACHARGYFPPDLSAYDVVHFNWQPATLNHYQPEVLPTIAALDANPVLSGFLHDLPPWSSWALEPYLDVTSALEPYRDAIVIPPPCLAYVPQVALSPEPLIGRTGIGDAGLGVLEEICVRRGWALSNSATLAAWVSNEEEIDRLARCWVNVVWYNYHRSRSSSASIVATARRPTILSECTRFDHLLPWKVEFYWAKTAQALEGQLMLLINGVADGWSLDAMRTPGRSVAALQWDKLIRPLLSAWEAA